MDDKKYWHVFIDNDEYFKIGKIISYLGTNFVVIKIQQDEMPDHSEIYALEDLKGNAFLFENATELEAWMNWLETPSDKTKPKIVSINHKDKH